MLIDIETQEIIQDINNYIQELKNTKYYKKPNIYTTWLSMKHDIIEYLRKYDKNGAQLNQYYINELAHKDFVWSKDKNTVKVDIDMIKLLNIKFEQEFYADLSASNIIEMEYKKAKDYESKGIVEILQDQVVKVRTKEEN